MTTGRHLSDSELQSLAESDPATVTIPAHLTVCSDCRETVAAYHRLGRELAALPSPLPPLDFTARLMARLPPDPPALGASDLVAVAAAAGAALVASILFVQSNGVARLLDLVGHLPGRALAEALLATTLRGRNAISLLLFLCVAAPLIGAALWGVLSRSERALA